MMMNKIIIDSKNIVIKENSVYYLKVNDNLDYHVKVLSGINSKLVIISENNDYNILYDLEKNSFLTINSLNYNNSVNIIINLNENSCIKYNHSVVNKVDSVNKFVINHLSSNTTSIINNNGINLSENKLFIKIDGNVYGKLTDVNCCQNSKIINYQNGNSKIIPNLLIESNDINASHSAFIGNFDDDMKFYASSRGINEEMLIRILYKAILLGTMDLTVEKEEFNKIINEWW